TIILLPSRVASLTRIHSPKWRNWQTRMVQVHVPARVWGFESPLRHHDLSRGPSLRSEFRLRAPALLTPARRLKFESPLRRQVFLIARTSLSSLLAIFLCSATLAQSRGNVSATSRCGMATAHQTVAISDEGQHSISLDQRRSEERRVGKECRSRW